MESQNKRVLDFLKRRKRITTHNALFHMYPCITRLGARIYELRQAGYNITDEWVYSYRYEKGEKTVKSKMKRYKYNG